MAIALLHGLEVTTPDGRRVRYSGEVQAASNSRADSRALLRREIAALNSLPGMLDTRLDQSGEDALVHGLRRPPVAPHAVHHPEAGGDAEHRGARGDCDHRESHRREGAHEQQRAASSQTVPVRRHERRSRRVSGEAERDNRAELRGAQPERRQK